MKSKKRLSLYVNDDEKKEFMKICKTLNVTASSVINQFIRDYNKTNSKLLERS